jgi:hypothetical protein
MVLVTSRAFMDQYQVERTLLGQLRRHWENNYGAENTWTDEGDIGLGTIDLPGVHCNKPRWLVEKPKRYAQELLRPNPQRQIEIRSSTAASLFREMAKATITTTAVSLFPPTLDPRKESQDLDKQRSRQKNKSPSSRAPSARERSPERRRGMVEGWRYTVPVSQPPPSQASLLEDQEMGPESYVGSTSERDSRFNSRATSSDAFEREITQVPIPALPEDFEVKTEANWENLLPME